MSGRSHLIENIANDLRSRRRSGRCLVAIDGIDASGKSLFADELTASLRNSGEPVVLIHLDDFHNLRERRHARGRDSPEGFWFDNYDYDAFERDVLAPLAAGGSGLYRAQATDRGADIYLDTEPIQAPESSVTVVEGIFLHRDELAKHWDYSIFLDVPFDVSVARMAERDGTSSDPGSITIRRYVAGQKLYFAECQPWSRATVIVDNTDWANPHVIPESHSHE